MKNHSKDRIDFFPFNPSQISGVGYMKINNKNLDFPDAHIIIFSNSNNRKTAYCLDFGLFTEGDDLKSSFENMKIELINFLSNAYSKKEEKPFLYTYSAPEALWRVYRDLAQNSKNDLFFNQNLNKNYDSFEKMITEKERKIKELETQLSSKDIIIKTQSEIIQFLKEQNLFLTQNLIQTPAISKKNWEKEGVCC